MIFRKNIIVGLFLSLVIPNGLNGEFSFNSVKKSAMNSFSKAKKEFDESVTRFKNCLQGNCSRKEALKLARDLGVAAVVVAGVIVAGVKIMSNGSKGVLSAGFNVDTSEANTLLSYIKDQNLKSILEQIFIQKNNAILSSYGLNFDDWNLTVNTLDGFQFKLVNSNKLNNAYKFIGELAGSFDSSLAAEIKQLGNRGISRGSSTNGYSWWYSFDPTTNIFSFNLLPFRK